VGPRAGPDIMEKRKILLLPGIEPRPPSPSLYRLSYPGSDHMYYYVTKFTKKNLKLCLIFNLAYQVLCAQCMLLLYIIVGCRKQ
jgi:hypothetical protein